MLDRRLYRLYDRYIRRPLIRWALRALQQEVYETAQAKGWWQTERREGELIALLHSECSEALEAVRNGRPQSQKIDQSEVEEELADVIIRLLDYAEYYNYDIAGATRQKLEYNKTRPHRHGGKEL